MSHKNKDIKKEIERTMNVLDEWKRPDSNPYFITRLNARLKDKTTVKGMDWAAVLRPTFLGLLVMVNLFTFYNINNNEQEYTPEEVAYEYWEELESEEEDYLSFEN